MDTEIILCLLTVRKTHIVCRLYVCVSSQKGHALAQDQTETGEQK